MKKVLILSLIGLIIITISCSKDNETTSPTVTVTAVSNVPDVYKKIYGSTDIYIEGNYVVIKTVGKPDHKSPYYKNTQWATTLYEAYNGSNSNYAQAPNVIASTPLTFKIPLNPTVASTHSATPMGAIGVSLNGTPFFNQYAAGGVALGPEINGFDQYNGHPQATGMYHYHVEPLFLTTSKGKNALLGFLLDGFPVYGPVENGATITNANLDAYHGHTAATVDYPNGIYHYHITDADPYLNGSGFYGTAGTVSQ